MSSTSNIVLWVGDTVRISTNAISTDGKYIDSMFTGDNYNWIVTEYDPTSDIAVLGSYSAFGKAFPKNPPITVSRKFLKIDTDRMVCRHPELSHEILLPVSPTCTSTGKTRGLKCGKCGKILKEQTIIPQLEHQYEFDQENGLKVCMLCKHEESTARKNLELNKNDIRAMIRIIEGMLTESTQKITPREFSGSYWNSMYTHMYHEEIYESLTYVFLESSLFNSNDPYKLPLIIYLSDSNTRLDQINTSLDTSRWAEDGFNTSATHVLIPKFSGNYVACKKEFFNLLKILISKYYIDETRIVLIGEGTGGAAVEFFMYQDPDVFSYQVIIDGVASSVDLESLKDISYKTALYSSGTNSHMNTLSDVFEVSLVECPSSSDGLDRVVTSSSLTNILSKQNTPKVYTTGTYVVKDDVVILKTSPYTYSESTDKQVFRGQLIPIVELKSCQNYTWGRVDPQLWKIDESENTSDVVELWLPLESMFIDSTSIDLDDYVLPCCFDSYGTDFTKYFKNYVELSHNGLDLVSSVGTPVFASKGGVVTEISKTIQYGTTLKISNSSSGEDYIVYSHLKDSKFDYMDEVHKGQLIGYIANSSDSSVTVEPHLHIGIFEDGNWVDPKEKIIFHK